MKVGRGRHVFLTCLTMLFFVFFIQPQVATAEKPSRFMVFAHEPMAGTYKEAYPEMEELYESDEQLVLIAYDGVSKSCTRLVRVQIENADGEKIFGEEREIKAVDEKRGSYILFSIRLDEALKAKLKPVFTTVRLALDGKTFEPRQIKFSGQSPMRKTAPKVMVLPFYSSTNEFFDYSSKDDILNTFADAVGNEMKRIMPEVVACDVTRAKVSVLKLKGCFENPSCLKTLQEMFGEGIFLIGDVRVPKHKLSLSTIRETKCAIYVINTRTGDQRKVASTYVVSWPGEKETYIMKKLISKSLNEEGLLAYIRALL